MVENILVSIRCITYNHEQYIRQCLDGFVMQKTDFPFVAIVHDDASTDGTAEIIREYAEKYPDIIKPIYEKENQYCKHDGSLERIMNAACTGKYIALCEGDDYWTDPHKLQKQVDFLESNPDYGMVYSDYDTFIQNRQRFIRNYGSKNYTVYSGDIFRHLFRRCFIRTLTTCIRADLFKNIMPTGDFFSGDLYYFYEISRQSKVHYDNSVSGVYRLLTNSASHSIDITKQREYSNALRKLDYYESQWLTDDNDKEHLKLKWFHNDIKYALRSNDIQLYRTLRHSHEYIGQLPSYYRLLFISELLFKLCSSIFRFMLKCKYYLMKHCK